jgi:hypothetical protein
MQEQKASLEPLGEAIEHFCHITNNFAPGLFHCYDVEGLPRTNNDLEHCGWRWHEFMSVEPQADAEPFQVWSCADPSA